MSYTEAALLSQVSDDDLQKLKEVLTEGRQRYHKETKKVRNEEPAEQHE